MKQTRNAEVNFAVAGASAAGNVTALYTQYFKSQMPQQDFTQGGNAGVKIAGTQIVGTILGQDVAANEGGLYTLYSQSQMPKQDSTNAVNLAAEMPKDEMVKYLTNTPPTQSKPAKIPAYKAVLKKLHHDMPLTPAEQQVADIMGIDWKSLRADVNVRKSSINNDMQELKDLSEGMRAAGIVASMLNTESGKGQDFGRLVHRWSNGFYSLDNKERQFINEADKFRKTLDKLQYGNQQSQYKDEKSIENYGIGQRFSSLKENVGIIKQGLETMINRMESILSTTNIKGMDLSKKDLGNIEKNYENGKKILSYLNTIENPEHFNERIIQSYINGGQILGNKITIID